MEGMQCVTTGKSEDIAESAVDVDCALMTETSTPVLFANALKGQTPEYNAF